MWVCVGVCGWVALIMIKAFICLVVNAYVLEEENDREEKSKRARY